MTFAAVWRSLTGPQVILTRIGGVWRGVSRLGVVLVLVLASGCFDASEACAQPSGSWSPTFTVELPGCPEVRIGPCRARMYTHDRACAAELHVSCTWDGMRASGEGLMYVAADGQSADGVVELAGDCAGRVLVHAVERGAR